MPKRELRQATKPGITVLMMWSVTFFYVEEYSLCPYKLVLGIGTVPVVPDMAKRRCASVKLDETATKEGFLMYESATRS